MGIRKKKKVVEPVVDEVTEEVVQAVADAIVEEAVEQDKTVEEVVNEIVEEAVIEAVDEIPEDAEVVEEVVIEPVSFKVGDRVELIEAVDYVGRPIPNKAYTIYSINGDKVILKDKGLICGSTKITNIK